MRQSMTATNEKSDLNEIAIRQAADQLRATYLVALLRKAAANVTAWVERNVTGPARARIQRQRQLEELMHMDDHMLRDLGLSRGGISYAFEHGREVATAANANLPPAKAPHAA
jgi:uncharacterized protein YjiS (DUF1127 family)